MKKWYYIKRYTDEIQRVKTAIATTSVCIVLTVLLVQEDLELVVNLVLQALVNAGDGLLVRQFPVHEGAAAGFLHHLRTDTSAILCRMLLHCFGYKAKCLPKAHIMITY
jgi:hypothetical protein